MLWTWLRPFLRADRESNELHDHSGGDEGEDSSGQHPGRRPEVKIHAHLRLPPLLRWVWCGTPNWKSVLQRTGRPPSAGARIRRSGASSAGNAARAPSLALAMQKYLDDLSCEAGVAPEWKELLRDLDRLQQVRLLATPPRTDSAGRQAEPCAGLVGCGSSAGRSS